MTVCAITGDKTMKTAKINVYHVFGTKNQTCADVTYRGKLLKRIHGIDTPQKHLDTARLWAYENGFTNTKIIYG